VTPRLWPGSLLRWYLLRARHPFKAYVVGHYWSWFAKLRVWIPYDQVSTISVQLGDYLQQQIFFEGYYERPLIEWMKGQLQPSDVFWDVGANIGAVTLVAARLCRQVVAFEPNPAALSLLKAHIATNGLTNVLVIDRALGSEPGRADLHVGPDHNLGMSSLMAERPDAPRVSVEVESADELVRSGGVPAPTVIKIDVEGAEHLVLEGAREVLAAGHVRAVVFEGRAEADGTPSNPRVARSLAGFHLAELGVSTTTADDGLTNFIATSGVS
jgi:FkbM family methyltransferase